MRVLIAAGEKSGFVLADLLSKKIRDINNEIEIYHLNLADVAGDAFGFSPRVLPKLLQGGKLINQLLTSVRDIHPDLTVLISCPGVNLPLGMKLRAVGVVTIIVGPPQCWAWGKWRVRLLQQAADQVVCLFSFEEQFFRRAGIRAVYFGYPFYDAVQLQMSRRQMYETLGIPEGEEYIILLPGTRKEEVDFHQPLFIRVFQHLQTRHPRLHGVIVGGKESVLPPGVVQVEPQHRYDIFSGARAALAVSGTVTAELAILGIPMVVSYHLDAVSKFFARIFVRIPYFALPNIIAGESVVPEYLNPDQGQLISQISRLLDECDYRQMVIAKLEAVRKKLEPAGATDRLARLIVTLVSRKI